MTTSPFSAEGQTSKPLPLISVQGGRYRVNLDHITNFEISDTSIKLSLSTGGHVLVTDKAEMHALTAWLDRQSLPIFHSPDAQ
jgi:hypothetical protein